MFAPDVRAYVQLLGDDSEVHKTNGEGPPPIDAFLTDGALRLEVDTPGVPLGNLRVRVESHVLVVEGDRKSAERFAIDPLLSLRSHGSFVYRLGLGDRCDIARIDAALANGVLSVTVPLLPSSPARHIAVRDGARVIPPTDDIGELEDRFASNAA